MSRANSMQAERIGEFGHPLGVSNRCSLTREALCFLTLMLLAFNSKLVFINLKKMKCTIPEISWHNREPVLSVDINLVFNDFYRVATAGGDNHVLIWQMTICENGAVKQEVISDLTRHQRAVNIVRWSPNGQYLASADDDANMIIWQLKTDNIPLLEGETADRETWIVYKVLRGHKEDIYDLCWSTSGLKLLSGSIDNTAILWDVSKGKMDHILTDHKGFVQGVAWDPKNQIIATLSTDRICRIFDTSGKHVRARIQKGKLPVGSDHFLHNKEVKFFYDDTFKSFFRRLQFSPDGSLLIAPSGHMEGEDCKKALNATLVFTLDNTNEPAMLLPHGKQCSTVVRCCPMLFELRQDGPAPLIDLPYRMIIAVGTDHDVILYDTQQRVPFARFQEIHYTRMTDLTWSSDGQLLVASSTDGFCALITFEPNELGVPYIKADSENEENTLDISVMEHIVQEKDENTDISNSQKVPKEAETDKKKRSFIEQWVQSPAPKRLKPNPLTISKGLCTEVSKSEKGDLTKKSPKRITPITLSSPTKRLTVIPVKDKSSNNIIDLTNDSTVEKVPEIVDNVSSTLVTKDKPKKVLQIPLKDVLLNKVDDDVRKIQNSPKRITPIPLKDEPSTKQTLLSMTPSSKKLADKSPKRITPIPVQEQSSNKEIDKKVGGGNLLSLEKVAQKVPKRITPIPVKEHVANQDTSDKTDGGNKSPTSEKVVVQQSTKTVTSTLENEQLLNMDTVEKGGGLDISQHSEKENNDDTSPKVTTSVTEIDKSSQSQNILSPDSVKSPRRIVPTPIKDKIKNSKSEDSQNSPSRVKQVSLNQKGPNKLEPKKTSTPPITAFFIKNVSKGTVGTSKKVPTRNEETGKEKDGKLEIVDLSSDD